MSTEEAPESAGVGPAPGWRRAAAGLLDAGVVAAVVFAVRRAGGGLAREQSRRIALDALGGLAGSALLERLGSPGERLMGVRTVDSRTGRPVELWRALLLTALGVGIRALRGVLVPRPGLAANDEQRGRREALARDIREVRSRYAADPEARDEAVIALMGERRAPAVQVDVGRVVAVTLVAGLVPRRLQRRLAPTTVVRRRAGAHNP